LSSYLDSLHSDLRSQLAEEISMGMTAISPRSSTRDVRRLITPSASVTKKGAFRDSLTPTGTTSFANKDPFLTKNTPMSNSRDQIIDLAERLERMTGNDEIFSYP